MKRTFALLVAVVSAAAVLSGCGGSTGPAAAKVGSASISRSTLDDELSTLAANKPWIRSVAPRVGATTMVIPSGGVNAKIATAWLNAMINQLVVDQIFERRDLSVTDADRRAAKTAADALFATDQGSTFDTFPKSFRDDYLRRQARFEAVTASIVDPSPDDADLQKYLDEAKLSYCPQGNAILHILVKTRAEADALEAQLAAGADFAKLARENTTDSAAASVGGFLTCTGSTTFPQLPAAIRDGVNATPLGSVSAPIETEFGFSIVKVTTWDVTGVRPLAQQFYDQNRPNLTLELVETQLKKTKVWVDPRYGRVQRSDRSVVIIAPVAPEPRNQPADTTTTLAPVRGQ